MTAPWSVLRSAGPALGVSLLIIAMVSCGPGRALSYDELKQVPEAQLFYPGSTVVHMQGNGQATGSIGQPPYPGTVGTDVDSSAAPQVIVAWYMQQLAKTGWTYAGRDSFEPNVQPDDAYVWTRGDYQHGAVRSEEFLLQFEPLNSRADPYGGANRYFILYTQNCCGAS